MRYLILLLCLPIGIVDAAPRVVTSIVPLQELTAELTRGVTEPDAIIGNQDSAHHFAFKPSHMRSLEQADLVIWISRRFEPGFSRVPDVLPQSTRLLELLPALGIAEDDGHIWYSPALLVKSADVISTTLVQIDPQHEALYLDNAGRFIAALEKWRTDMRARWHDKRPRYITDHSFSAHFEADTGLAAIASIHDQHDDHGGLKELSQLEQLLREKPAACLLTHQDHISPLAQSIADKYDILIINLSRVTLDQPPSRDILRRLDRFTTALLECL